MKTFTYLVRNFYDDDERFIIVGAHNFTEAVNCFCRKRGLVLDTISESTGSFTTIFDKWLLLKIK